MESKYYNIAINGYLKSLKVLQEIGIMTNKKDFTSQVGEWLAEKIFDGYRSENGIQKYWDIHTSEGEKIQVKTHSKALTTTARWSAVKYNIDAEVDFVVIIVFSEDYKLNEFYKVPWKDCLNLIRRNKDRDVLMWDHLDKFRIENHKIPNQEIVTIFTNKE